MGRRILATFQPSQGRGDVGQRWALRLRVEALDGVFLGSC